VLTGLAESLQLFATAPLAGLLVIRLPAHLFAEAAALAELPKPSDRFLNRLSRANP